MANLLSGRLVTDGTGRLYIHPTNKAGEVVEAIHTADPGGMGTDTLVSGMIEVAWDEEAGGYVEVQPGEKSHNERHEQNIVDVSGTSGPLFDQEGNLVVPGDPHHVEALPTDAHYDPDAPGRVTAKTDDDEIAPRLTGHTEAYTR